MFGAHLAILGSPSAKNADEKKDVDEVKTGEANIMCHICISSCLINIFIYLPAL